jgi:CRISPR-associated protein Csm1
MMELFFSGWVRDIMEADRDTIIQQILEIDNINREDFEKYLRSASIDLNNIYTVYSGGDDLVLVGPWETMIVFSIFLNMQFRKFTCNNEFITLSAGLAFVKEKHPIASAIRQADELLETSKKSGKDSITLFGTTIIWEKLPDLVNFFLFLDRKLNQEEPEINTAFLHRLLEYHNMAVDFIVNHNLEGLKYVSALSYDLGRNVVKWDKDGKITKGRETYDFLTERIINRKPEKGNAPIYNLKVPLFWALYRNRKAQIEKD